MSDDLLAQANAATGGQELWKTLRALRIDISIGGPIWAMKGWPPDGTFDQMVTLDTVRERIVFTPFPRPDRRMIFGAAVPAAPARGRCAGQRLSLASCHGGTDAHGLGGLRRRVLALRACS